MVSRRAQRFVLTGLVVAVAAYALLRYVAWQSVEITDASRPASIVLSQSRWPSGDSSGLSIRVSGEIDGEAEIGINDGTRRRLSGQIDLQVRDGDWYMWDEEGRPVCFLYYQPGEPTSGRLLIHYKFYNDLGF